MNALNEINLEPITYTLSALTIEQVIAFRHATKSFYSSKIPPTFSTVFRKAEFQFLERCDVDMRLLLHVEQAYEYLSELQVGDMPVITTKIQTARERRGMYFFTLQTEVSCAGKLRVRSTTQFVIRPPTTVPT